MNDVERIRSLADGEVVRMIRSGGAASLSDAQAQVARLGGLKDWAEFEAWLQALAARESHATISEEVRQLKRAIAADDLQRVQRSLGGSARGADSPSSHGRLALLT